MSFLQFSPVDVLGTRARQAARALDLPPPPNTGSSKGSESPQSPNSPEAQDKVDLLLVRKPIFITPTYMILSRCNILSSLFQGLKICAEPILGEYARRHLQPGESVGYPPPVSNTQPPTAELLNRSPLPAGQSDGPIGAVIPRPGCLLPRCVEGESTGQHLQGTVGLCQCPVID